MQKFKISSSILSLKLLLVSILFSNNLSYAQQLSRDSIASVIKTTSDKNVKSEALNALAKILRFEKPDTARLLLSESITISLQSGNKVAIANALNIYGNTFFISNSDSAILYFKKSVPVYSQINDSVNLSRAFCNIATAYTTKTVWDSALLYSRNSIALLKTYFPIDSLAKVSRQMWNYAQYGVILYYATKNDSSIYYCIQSIAMAETLGDEECLAKNYVQLANIYNDQKNYAKAIEYNQKGFEIWLKRDNSYNSLVCLNNLALAYRNNNQLRLAEAYCDTALFYITKFDLPFFFSAVYSTKASISIKQNNCKKALEECITGLNYCKTIPNEHWELFLYFHSGNANSCLGKYADAKTAFSKAIERATDDMDVRMNCFKGLSEAEEKLGNYKSSVQSLKSYLSIRDSLFSIEKSKTIDELSTRFETQKKEQQILVLAKENEIKSVLAANESQQKNFAYIGIIGLMIFGGYTFYLYSKRKKLSNQLSVSLNDLKSTQQQLIQTEREKEAENIRLRISRDIHDDIGHSLTKISLLSDMTAGDKQINSPEAIETLGRISDYSRNVNTSLSEIVWAISPTHDSLDSLIVYMRNHIHKFFENTGITYKINFSDTYENRPINPELKRNIFLVLKESLNNILKYAKAKNVTVDFKIEGNQFELKIKDDGVGFNPSPLGRLGGVGGNGLPNMKHRIEQTGGSFEINSSAGNGCEIKVNGSFNS